MIGNSSLGPGAEFDAIRRMLETWGPRASGIGDDAAIARLPRGDALIASVDSAVENRHFKSDWLSPREIGYRAIAAALSDLAAMAARPLGVLVAMAIPDAWRGRLDDIAAGVGDAVEAAGTHVLGGNLTDATELSITTTALGSAFSPLVRGGANLGDHVYVTGRLGAPASAIRRLLAGDSPGAFRERFAHPVPRLLEARWLADHGATSAIDISDGFVADLRHVAHASGVAIEIEGGTVPCFPDVPAQLAVESGEEYELIVTAPGSLDVGEFQSRFKLPLTRVGGVVGGRPGHVDVRGIAVANARGHDHFSR
jgi:thiamine-monophosphate kinase